MLVEIVHLPKIPVACVEHRGSELQLGASQQKLIQWRKANGLSPSTKHRTYVCYFNDPKVTPANELRLKLCVSICDPIKETADIKESEITAGRYARVRHLGSRHDITAASWLYEKWLPNSTEQHDPNRPLVMHFVNMGPDIPEMEQQTDVYLPLL